jgi:hypothetical protein
MTMLDRVNSLPLEHKQALAAWLSIVIENYVKAVESDIIIVSKE